jgi:chemotaxis receptor (MCP) glutamine deamidase CheD
MNLFQTSGSKPERVGIAEFKVASHPEAVLTSAWLGSGIGLTAYDAVARAGGLLHVPFADSATREPRARLQPALFVDTGLTAFFQALARAGTDSRRLTICLAGGGRFTIRNAATASGQDIFAAARSVLTRLNLAPQVEHRSAGGDCRCGLELAAGEVRLNFSGQTRVTVLWKSSTAT